MPLGRLAEERHLALLPDSNFGTILDPNGNITIHDKTFGGEYIGENVTITSNPTITNVPFAPAPDGNT